MASPAVEFARSNQPRFLDELKALLRIPSVSTLEEHRSDVKKAADYVAADLRRIGMENVELIPTKGHPLLYADWLHAPGKPTVLMYAHYDVQPPDPIDEWHTPPFEPTERNRNLYARGAVDDKGQLWMEVKALESLMQAHGGKLPINVKVIFEGEEEVGGESIAAYVRKEKAKLKADFALVCDTELFAPIYPLSALACAVLCIRDRSRRRENGFAFRNVWRSGSQPVLCPDRNHQQAERLEGQGADPWLL
jgi:Acetylornithine deacetylase/Succinyl-diaminopimelate desuccinylase and related deacylases